MPEERKISDVVLDLENKVHKLAAVCQNIEHNTKVIIDKLNKLGAKNQSQRAFIPVPPGVDPNSKIKIESSGQQVSVKDKNFAGEIPAKPNNKTFTAEAAVELPVDPSDRELTVETIPKGKRRDSRQQVDLSVASKKTTVSQKIVLPNGDGVFLAGVEIIDNTGKCIKQTRTNDKGRWMAPLEAGEYTVHILKRPNETLKLPIELKYQIIIPESQKPLELPSPTLSDAYLKK